MIMHKKLGQELDLLLVSFYFNPYTKQKVPQGRLIGIQVGSSAFHRNFLKALISVKELSCV